MKFVSRSRLRASSALLALCSTRVPLAGLAFGLLACGPAEKDPTMNPPAAGAAMITDADNFTSHTELNLKNVNTPSGVDLTICWDQLAKDVRDRVASPAQVDMVILTNVTNQTHDVVKPRLELGNLEPGEVTYYKVNPDKAAATKCTTLSAMMGLDPATAYVEKPGDTYLVTLNQGNVPGAGTLGLMYLTPSTTAPSDITNNTVNFPANSFEGVLNFMASLSATPAIAISAAGPTWTVDWSGVTMDSQDQPMATPNKLQLAFVPKTAAEVGADILHLEQNATQLWEKSLAGAKQATLGEAVERTSGMPFSATGFNNGQTGTWVLALSSTKTQNPTPLVLVALAPM